MKVLVINDRLFKLKGEKVQKTGKINPVYQRALSGAGLLPVATRY